MLFIGFRLCSRAKIKFVGRREKPDFLLVEKMEPSFDKAGYVAARACLCKREKTSLRAFTVTYSVRTAHNSLVAAF